MIQQEIRKSQQIQPHIIHGGARYNPQAANWKELKFRSSFERQQQFLNLQDYSYDIVKKSLFCFAPSTSNPTSASLYSYNFVTQEIKEWRADEDTNTPPLRRKYGLLNYDERLCMFGGFNEVQYFNDLYSYCSYSNVWTSVVKETNTVLPSPRIPFIFSQVQNGNLLLFGGFNEKGILKDAYLLKNFIWHELSVQNNKTMQLNFGFIDVLTKSGMRNCSTKKSIFFFGGFDGVQYSNALYQMKANDQNFSLKIIKVTADTGPRPCPRAFHSMQRVGQTSFAVYGGTNGVNMFRDISIFDFTRQKWTEVYPLNGPLVSINQSKMFYELKSLYLMGWVTEKNSQRKAIFQVCFPEFQIIKSEICANCIRRLDLKQKEEMIGAKKPFVSNGLIYNMAMQISFPFQAFALLLDCAQALKATQLSIKSEETNNKLSYLEIRFNGNHLNREQYSSVISHSYLSDPLVLEVIDRLKLGAMRLGKTLIYVSVVNNLRRVFLFSSDGLIISHYHELYAYFSYQERIQDQWLSTQEGVNHKKFILNMLHSYLINPSKVINSVTNQCFFIFESNVIMTTQKIYYGEIITSPIDISLCKSRKKVQFLDNLGFKLNEDPEVSLSKYLEYLYLSPGIRSIAVQNKTIVLQQNKYLQELQKLQANMTIKALCKQKLIVKEVEAQCYIYQVVDPSKYTKQLKGILTYYQGRLINRLDTNFGDLFWQKFFKTKYKKPFGLWTHVGVIHFLKGVEPKSMRNQFKSQNYYNHFIRYLKKEYINKSKTTVINEMDDEGKPTKQVKK